MQICSLAVKTISLRGLRKEGIPNIWIPKADDFVKIDALPLLGSGKLDLMALRKMADAL